MAPHPKPTILKKIEGNPGKRPLNENEPQPLPVEPECPHWLMPEAKAEWKRIAPELLRLGLLTHIDKAALAGYCQAYARWSQAEARLTKRGLLITTQSGYQQQRAEVSIAQRYLAILKSFIAEFGLSPSSRARMVVPGGHRPTEDPEAELEASLTGRSN
ncbi:MAG: phage terminase small subunit P27 family [bacterium]